jgi:putative transposase
MDPKKPTRQPYPSDLSDDQWELIKKMIPQPPNGGPQEHLWGEASLYSRREIVNALLYVRRTGCQWRYLPHDFPPWDLVYSYFQRFTRRGLLERIDKVLRRRIRRQMGRKATATAGIMDSQTVAATATGGGHGYDAGKRIRGRKRHLLVDTTGLLVTVHVTSGDVQDRDAALPLLRLTVEEEPTLKKVWTDAAYQGPRVSDAAEKVGIDVEVVANKPKGKGFQLVARRWVVERSFGWLHWDRRLNRDYEKTTSAAEGFVHLGFIGIMLNRDPEEPEGTGSLRKGTKKSA